MALKKPDWWKYEETSSRVYVDAEALADFEVPLVPNYPELESLDTEPQRIVPLYVDFERGTIFYYQAEADELRA